MHFQNAHVKVATSHCMESLKWINVSVNGIVFGRIMY